MPKKFLYIAFSALIIFTLFSCGQSFASSNNIANAAANAKTFSPDGDGIADSTAISYSTSILSYVQIVVYNYKGKVKLILPYTKQAPGKHSATWNGNNDSGVILPNGTYSIEIRSKYNGVIDKAYLLGTVKVPVPQITKSFVQPSTFSPDGDNKNDAQRLDFQLSTRSYVTVQVFNYKGVVRTIVANRVYSKGDNHFWWWGSSDRKATLPNGTYKFVVTAKNSAGSATFSGLTTIKSTPAYLSHVRPTVNPFSPNGDRNKDWTGITYELDKPGKIMVKVYSYKGEVKTITPGMYRKPGIHYELWDGFDNKGWIVTNGNYKYTVTSENAAGVTSISGVVTIEGVDPNGGYSILIDKSNRRLYLYRGKMVVKTYPIAIGRRGFPTPTGNYTVVRKDVNPTWYPPSWADEEDPVPYPLSPLGPRRLLLSDRSYGIHGTRDPSAIGRAVTHGCIRLYNADIIELYKIIPVGTKVRIVE